jgi:hypothetical protein
VATPSSPGSAALASPFERSEQLVLDKEFGRTDARLTLAEPPPRQPWPKSIPTTAWRRTWDRERSSSSQPACAVKFTFGTLQATFSKADARQETFNGIPGTVTPEAPRTISVALTTLDRLPLGVHARAEYEYVGHKFLDWANQPPRPIRGQSGRRNKDLGH